MLRGLPARGIWQLQQGPFLDEDAIDHELVQHLPENARRSSGRARLKPKRRIASCTASAGLMP